ncbi:unnamed protein product, partial [Brachionus calyciflorus]
NDTPSSIQSIELPDIDLNHPSETEQQNTLHEDQQLLVINEESEQPETPTLATLNNVIGEANQVLYSNVETFVQENYVEHVNIESNECQASQVQPVRVNRLISLYDQMQQIDDESESEEEFDFINGIRDTQVLDRMFEEKRRERALLDANIKQRFDELKSEEIQNEIHRYWLSRKLTRQRITEHDVKLAKNRLKKKIREE